jgi:nucleotidyltransferase/DNA polymerase involved in DNA repair
MRAELAALGYAPALAVAPLPAAARVLAACREGFCSDREGSMRMALADVALAHSGLAPGTISLLYNVGARTLGDAFALPRPELGKRIGAEQMAALDRLRGAERAILPLYRPPDRFEHRIEFDHRIDAWPPLLFPLRRLCGELALFLAARDGGVQRCALALDHEDRATTRVAIELLTPQRDAQMLYELVRSRLERVTLAAPVSAIALIAEDLPEFRPRHQDLFEPQRGQTLEWPQLAERLRAHLGDEAVRRLEPAADHRPEKAWRFVGERDDTRGAAPRPAAAADKRRIAEKMLREARPPIAGAGSDDSASAPGNQRDKPPARPMRLTARKIRRSFPRRPKVPEGRMRLRPQGNFIAGPDPLPALPPTFRRRKKQSPTPNCTACPASASSAAPRARRSCSSAPANSAMRRWRSPTSARWPASCARTKRRGKPGCA